MTIRQYRTEWYNCDNVYLSLHDDDGEQVGCVEVCIYTGPEHKDESLIWNLHVDEQHRSKLYGKELLTEAVNVAKAAGSTSAVLEWNRLDSPLWVRRWYERHGFEEEEVSDGYTLMRKNLKMQHT